MLVDTIWNTYAKDLFEKNTQADNHIEISLSPLLRQTSKDHALSILAKYRQDTDKTQGTPDSLVHHCCITPASMLYSACIGKDKTYLA
ncbi:hypothetical protein BH11PSE12_BH11PSE12_04700 [soil metagenome]